MQVHNFKKLGPATTKLAGIIKELVQSSLQPVSVPTYKRAWSPFYQFLNMVMPDTPTTLPISPSVLALFIAYLYDRQYAPSTVNTYVSTLGYSHKLAGHGDLLRFSLYYKCLKDTERRVLDWITDSPSLCLFLSVFYPPLLRSHFQITTLAYIGQCVPLPFLHF